MLQIDIDEKDLERAVDMFGALERQIVRARISSFRRTRQHIETTIKKYVAEEERIPRRAMAHRFYAEKISPKDEVLTLWVGANPIDPMKIGKVAAYGIPGKTGGVRVGRRTYGGAFLAKVYGNKAGIWIRLKSKRYDRDLYPASSRAIERGGGGRFPVVKPIIRINKHVKQVIASNEAHFAEVFLKNFKQNLHYQVNVRGEK